MSTYNSISEVVKAIGEQFRKVIEESQLHYYQYLVKKFNEVVPKDAPSHEQYEKMRKSNIWIGLNRVVSITSGYPQHYFLPTDIEQKIADKAKKDSDEIIAGFVHKMTSKLSDLLPVGKGINVEARGTSPSSNTLRFRFSDGGYFTLVNKVVTVWNARGGQPFNRFPSTFHDAVLGNGTKVNNPSEAAVKLAFGGVDIKNKPVDPSICPASGKPWPEMTNKRGGRIAYRSCPECGAGVAYQNMYGETPFKIRKHKKNMKESADILTIFSWLKRNQDLFDKKDLVRQLMSRFHIDKDVAIKYINQPSLTEVGMIAFNKYKLDPAEEDSLMWLIADREKGWEKAQAAQNAGKFNKLAAIIELAKFYERAGYLTQKQMQTLEKWKVFDYKPKRKESFGGSYARPSNYPVQSGLPPTSVKEAFGLNEEYDAEFAGWQSWPNHDPLPLYNIIKKDHHLYKSTVSPKTLDKLGLKYPQPPPYQGEK